MSELDQQYRTICFLGTGQGEGSQALGLSVLLVQRLKQIMSSVKGI